MGHFGWQQWTVGSGRLKYRHGLHVAHGVYML